MKKPGRPSRPIKKKATEGFRPFGALASMRDELRAGEAAKPAEPARPPSPPAARTDPAWDEETMALHRMMSGVTPLSTKKQRIPRSQAGLTRTELEVRRAVGEDRAEEESRAVAEHLRALAVGGQFEVEDDGGRVQGRRHGISPAVMRRLRRGLMPIDARLDLHGQTAAEARQALETFLRLQRARNERCVLIVHGKGEHSPGRIGVLRGEIAAWLSQGPGSAHVAAFATAREEDGGEGAVYVLLTR